MDGWMDVVRIAKLSTSGRELNIQPEQQPQQIEQPSASHAATATKGTGREPAMPKPGETKFAGSATTTQPSTSTSTSTGPVGTGGGGFAKGPFAVPIEGLGLARGIATTLPLTTIPC